MRKQRADLKSAGAAIFGGGDGYEKESIRAATGKSKSKVTMFLSQVDNALKGLALTWGMGPAA